MVLKPLKEILRSLPEEFGAFEFPPNTAPSLCSTLAEAGMAVAAQQAALREQEEMNLPTQACAAFPPLKIGLASG